MQRPIDRERLRQVLVEHPWLVGVLRGADWRTREDGCVGSGRSSST
jgi:hypothetical protein